MINKLPIKIILTVLAGLFLLWLALSGWPNDNGVAQELPSADSTTLISKVSSIQPISNAGADATEFGVRSGSLEVRNRAISPLSDDDLVALKNRFDQANAAIERGQLESAVVSLEALTSDFPSIIEPYLNLASVYAEQQNLEKARTTLLKGFEANPKAGMLFDHLKKVHGALAADSYRQALDTNTAKPEQTGLTLARASNIVTQLDQSNKIALLEKQLQDRQGQINSSAKQLQADQIAAERVRSLEARLTEVQANNLSARSAYESEISGLRKQLAEQSQALSRSQTAEREALARVVRAEQDALNKVAEITRELESEKATLLASQTGSNQSSELFDNAQRSQVIQRQAAERARLAKQVVERVNATASRNQSSNSVQEENAIALVRSWARAWSAQDVAKYVGHYADGYSSSQSLSPTQWLEQRQIRLTNKAFINVSVSDFKVKDLGARFTVTFTQYYQSNTVDDTVTKRLTFEKSQTDWSGSKIINERLVSN